MEVEERMLARYGQSYLISKNVVTYLKGLDSSSNNLILLPPTDYFVKKQVYFAVPEPVVFYYYTGEKAVWANQKDALRSTYGISIERGNLKLEKLTDSSRNKFLEEFNNYEISL